MPPRCSNCGRFMRVGGLLNVCGHCEEMTINFLSLWVYGGLVTTLFFHHQYVKHPSRPDLMRWEDDGGALYG